MSILRTKDIVEWSVIIPLPLTILSIVLSYCFVPMIYIPAVMIGTIGITIMIWFLGVILKQRFTP